VFRAYLQGIETDITATAFAIFVNGFEPTYKELKHKFLTLSIALPPSFEPTYKELKQSSSFSFQKFQSRFRAYLQGIETIRKQNKKK